MSPQDPPPVLNPCMKAWSLTVGYGPLGGMPYRRLRGRWLRDAGSAIGRKVKVEVSEGRLILEPVD